MWRNYLFNVCHLRVYWNKKRHKVHKNEHLYDVPQKESETYEKRHQVHRNRSTHVIHTKKILCVLSYYNTVLLVNNYTQLYGIYEINYIFFLKMGVRGAISQKRRLALCKTHLKLEHLGSLFMWNWQNSWKFF